MTPRETAPISVDAMVFDMDGTLTDTLDDLAFATNEMLCTYDQLPLSREQVCRYIGDGARDLVSRALGEARIDPDEALNRFRDIYTRVNGRYTTTYTGIREMLAHFADKNKAVLTNKPYEYAPPLLEQLELGSFFEIVVGGGVGIKLKPDPQALQQIIDDLGVDRKRTVMIGDSKNDILVAKAAGVISCAVTYGFRSREQLVQYQPDVFVDSPLELTEVFS